jgi:formamidopyrimidine-DNA glycosylase
VIHLKMTGQLVFVGVSTPIVTIPSTNYHLLSTTSEDRFAGGHPNDSLVNSLPDKSTRVTIEFDDGSHLFFNDQRKFGWVRLMPTLEVPNLDFMKRVGPEPLEPDFTAAEFSDRFKRRLRTTIKAAILDQSVIAGVGNIYADEALWGAQIHPANLVGDLPDSKFQLLYSEVRQVMSLSIEKGGSTNRNYVNAEGKKGSYMDFARVFRREGQACVRCGTEIIKIRVAGRGTHVCPTCQPVAIQVNER